MRQNNNNIWIIELIYQKKSNVVSNDIKLINIKYVVMIVITSIYKYTQKITNNNYITWVSIYINRYIQGKKL